MDDVLVPGPNRSYQSSSSFSSSLLKVASEFTEQNDREVGKAKRLWVTNETWLLLACFVVSVLHLTLIFSVFFFLQNNICLKKVNFGGIFFSNKIIVTLVTQGLQSSFLSRLVGQVR